MCSALPSSHLPSIAPGSPVSSMLNHLGYVVQPVRCPSCMTSLPCLPNSCSFAFLASPHLASPSRQSCPVAPISATRSSGLPLPHLSYPSRLASPCLSILPASPPSCLAGPSLTLPGPSSMTCQPSSLALPVLCDPMCFVCSHAHFQPSLSPHPPGLSHTLFTHPTSYWPVPHPALPVTHTCQPAPLALPI